MSPELRALIDEHRARLRRLLAEHSDLFTELGSKEPTLIEREAAATSLHSFYTGVEFIMRSIAEAFDGGLVKTSAWHVALLEAMRKPTARRAALLSPAVADRLREYMLFRHRFRNLYSFELEWTLMKPLVLGLDAMLVDFEAELGGFLAGVGGA